MKNSIMYKGDFGLMTQFIVIVMHIYFYSMTGQNINFEMRDVQQKQNFVLPKESMPTKDKAPQLIRPQSQFNAVKSM